MITQVRSPAVTQESAATGSQWCSIWSTLSKPQIYDVGANGTHIRTYTYTEKERKVERPSKERETESHRVVSCRVGAFVLVPRCRYRV